MSDTTADQEFLEYGKNLENAFLKFLEGDITRATFNRTLRRTKEFVEKGHQTGYSEDALEYLQDLIDQLESGADLFQN